MCCSKSYFVEVLLSNSGPTEPEAGAYELFF